MAASTAIAPDSAASYWRAALCLVWGATTYRVDEGTIVREDLTGEVARGEVHTLTEVNCKDILRAGCLSHPVDALDAASYVSLCVPSIPACRVLVTFCQRTEWQWGNWHGGLQRDLGWGACTAHLDFLRAEARALVSTNTLHTS